MAATHNNIASNHPESENTVPLEMVPAAAPSSPQPSLAAGGQSRLLLRPRRPSFSHGMMSINGVRRQMEDTMAAELGFLGPRYDFFGLYGGHGGSRVAEACRDRLHHVLAEEVAAQRLAPGGAEGEIGVDVGWWGPIMSASFDKMDKSVAEDDVPNATMTVGSTALVAVVGPCRIIVANCGDSRAVLSRSGRRIVALSTDHKPYRAYERERIEAAGGRVINMNGYRVCGMLSTSRSIGDHYLQPFVIPEPEIMVTHRSITDEFLILATNGLWDIISAEDACRAVRVCLSGLAARRFPERIKRRDASEAASVLLKLALSRCSFDNISLCVVLFKKLRVANLRDP